MAPTIPTRRRVEYARGYLELGLFTEAVAELDAIPEHDAAHVEVASCRVDVHMETKDWARVIDAAQIVCSRKPGCERAWIAWAYALRELQRVEEARDVLIRAERLHPRCGVLHYNLACYYCLLGDQVEAERRLTVAGELDDAWLQSALQDPDLRGMRSRLASQD